QPASIAANTYFGWKWMSAITGMGDLRAIFGSAAASSALGTATRTIWQPAAVSSAICRRVASTSAVGVVVIDCTDTGASPPTGTVPTISCLLRRRFASCGGTVGIPSATVLISPRRPVRCRGGQVRSGQPHRVDDIGGQGEQEEPAQHQDHHV